MLKEGRGSNPSTPTYTILCPFAQFKLLVICYILAVTLVTNNFYFAHLNRLCLELVQSAALVLSREEANANNNNNNNPSSSALPIYPPMSEDHSSSSSGNNNNNNIGNLNLDSRLVYLNLGAAHQMGASGDDDHGSHNNRHGSSQGGGGCEPTMYHHHHHHSHDHF